MYKLNSLALKQNGLSFNPNRFTSVLKKNLDV